MYNIEQSFYIFPAPTQHQTKVLHNILHMNNIKQIFYNMITLNNSLIQPGNGASSKIRGRDNITIGTWNTRTLRAAGKLQELTHEMDRYRWNILGLCEMKWKNFGETTTEEEHKVFFCGKEHKHEHGA